MKIHAAILCSLLATSATAGDDAASAKQPNSTAPHQGEFSYLNEAGERRSLGPAAGDWRLGFLPCEDLRYAQEGGRGELIALDLIAVVAAGNWQNSFKNDSLNQSRLIVLTISAEGLRDVVVTLPAQCDSSVRGSDDAQWVISAQLGLHELQQHWGRLPARITLRATLTQGNLPAPSSPAMSIALVSIPRGNATWMERLISLRVGQSRQDVVALLGKPISENATEIRSEKAPPAEVELSGKPHPDQPADRGRMLIYVDPDVHPELPPSQRIKWRVLIDSQGHYAGWFPGC